MQSRKKSMLVFLVAFLLPILVLQIEIPSASAKALCGQCLWVQSVYTTDTSNNNKTSFVAGNGIWLHVDVTSQSETKTNVDVLFEVIYNGKDLSNTFGYYKTEHAEMPPGLTRFYTPITIPANASPGEYMVRIQVTDSNNPDDDPWNSNTFTVQAAANQPQPNHEIFAKVPAIVETAILCGAEILGQIGVKGGHLVIMGHNYEVIDTIDKGTTRFLVIKDLASHKLADAITDLIPGESCVEFAIQVLPFPAQTGENYHALLSGTIQAAIDSLCAEVKLLPRSTSDHQGLLKQICNW